MTKWEYCELEVGMSGGVGPARLWHYKADGNHLEGQGKLGVVVANLGLEGWELVVASARARVALEPDRINYVFKRPLNG